MSDPLRTETSRTPAVTPDLDRDAKIEQLLLTGLDHYFAAQYEQAINVWTRALFLDRSHARAHAYIDRARSALAERQRESEELLQTGMAAFDRGDPEEAKRLLRAAIKDGAPPDEALVVLERLNRLEHTGLPPPRPTAGARARALIRLGGAPRPVRVAVLAAALLMLAAGATWVVLNGAAAPWQSWVSLQPAQAGAVASTPAATRPLPLPRRGETALARAQELADSGRLRDALTTLDLVRPTDPERAEADRLRTDIQRRLLTVTSYP